MSKYVLSERGNNALRAYTVSLAAAMGVSVVGFSVQQYVASPSVQQSIESKIQEDSTFLSMINNIAVNDQEGEKLALSATGTIASRTDTSGGTKREPVDPTDIDTRGYRCEQTNYDTYVRYAKLDMWAKFDNFQELLVNEIVRQIARDIITIGWNGTSAAADTDRVANPLLQDVNIGWLEKLRTEAPAQVMDEFVAASGQVTVGAGGDYENLDALVYDAVQMLHPNVRSDPEMHAFVGHSLIHKKYFPIVNQANTPENQLARDIILSTEQLGGLQAARALNFPATSVFISRFDNISRYYQEGKLRRKVDDQPELDRIVTFQSSNDAFVLEEVEAAVLVENIVFI
jgi:P2 family phage major capsid protein